MVIDRNGKLVAIDGKQDRLLRKMYTTRAGRAVISVLINPRISQICGRLLDSHASKYLVPLFVKNCHIELDSYERNESREYESFNDFFARKIKSECRPIDTDKSHLISPCDARLSMNFIGEDSTFVIKNTRYTLEELLRDKKLAKEYEGGYIGIFRLCVDDYHRYHYIDDGKQSHERKIRGVFHTVNPIANDVYPVYKENTREYCIHRTDNFGDVIVMEVGALLVGKIVNEKERCMTCRGEEKGYFEYGGSTVVLIFRKDTIIPDEDILVNTAAGYETKVQLGEKIGIAMI